MRFFFTLIGLILITISANSQCCSPGNPIGGSTNMGILSKGTLRTITSYRYSYSDTYFEGTEKSDFNFVKDAYYNYIGTTVNYGIAKKINIETELGYYLNRIQNYNIEPEYQLRGFGMSNAVVSLKYGAYKNSDKEQEWTFSAGAKIPFSRNPLIVDNVELPLDVQPSTMSYGIVAQSFLYKGNIENGLHFFLMNRFEKNFESLDRYTFGNALFNSFFVSKVLNHHWMGIVQLRNEIRAKDIRNGNEIESSGGVLMYIAPQINYNIAQKWNISILADLPIYKNYNGNQLSNKMGFSLILMRDFNFIK